MTMQLENFLTLTTDTGDTLQSVDAATARDGTEFDGLIGALLLASGNVPPDPAQLHRVVGKDLPFDGSMLPVRENPARLHTPEAALLSNHLAAVATHASAIPTAATQAPALPAAAAQASAIPAALTERTSQRPANNAPEARPDSGLLSSAALQKGSQATDVRESVPAGTVAPQHGLSEWDRPAAPKISPAVVSNSLLTSGRPLSDAPPERVTTELRRAEDVTQRAQPDSSADLATRRTQLSATQTDIVGLRPLAPQAAAPGANAVPLPIPLAVPNPVPDTKPRKHQQLFLPDIAQRVHSEQPRPVQPELTQMSRIDTARPDASLQAAVIDVATTKITVEPLPERFVTTPNITAAQGMSALSQTTGVTATGSTSTSVFTIDTPVDSPDWGDAVSNRVTMLVGRSIGSAELRLSPADLGPVQVQLSVEDGVAKVAFSATHPVTREQLESSLPRLREMLEQQGMTLADASVSDQRGGEHAATGEFEPESANGMSRANSGPDELNATAATASKVTEAGRVDTFV